jgi:16S rRNA (cytosine967-C5)-methyltransferase
VSQPLSNAREIAYDAYAQVMEKGTAPDDAVDELAAKSPAGKALTRLDRNFIKEMLYGALRWHSKIYWILQNTSNRNLDDATPQIRAALVMGTYQIFYMDRVPDRAAVNESAEYVRKKGQAQAVSFVNGILRQIARRAEYFAKPDKHLKPVEYVALQFAHPEWVVKRWAEHFKFDRMEKMLAANNQQPPWYVRMNSLKTHAPDAHVLQQQLLKDEGAHTDRRPLRCSLLFKEAPNLDDNSLFAQGFYTIQDEASQLVGMLSDARPGETIVDACAGPGGKLTHVFELAEGKAHITAVEKDPTQFLRMRETAARLGHADNISWVQDDFLAYKPEAKVDKVLLDAPCSGLGVLRRHPEGKWHKKPDLITRMAAQQRTLIEHALGMLKPGGELVYSVCSFEPEETEAHVAWIKDKLGDRIELVSPIQRLPDYYKRYVTRDNVMMIYAGNQDELDGFGAFILKVK